MSIDLHVHSIYSTGGHGFPEKIFRMAKRRWLSTLVLTEHNTMDSYKDAVVQAEKYVIETFPGIEFFTDISALGEKRVHLLAYLFDPDAPPFHALMAQVERVNRETIDLLVRDLATMGIDVTEEDILRTQAKLFPETVGKNVHGTHRMGIVRRAALHLAVAHPARDAILARVNRALPQIPIGDIVQAIDAAHGITLWAHPFQTRRPGGDMDAEPEYRIQGYAPALPTPDLEEALKHFRAMLDKLRAAGVDGYEAYTIKHPPEVIGALLEYADKENLPYSGGGDTHSPDALGIVPVPEEVVGRLRRYRARKFGR